MSLDNQSSVVCLSPDTKPLNELENKDGECLNTLSMYNYPETNLSTDDHHNSTAVPAHPNMEGLDSSALGLAWQDGIATLPGSDLQFRLNPSGELEVISDEEQVNQSDPTLHSNEIPVDEGQFRSTDELQSDPTTTLTDISLTTADTCNGFIESTTAAEQTSPSKEDSKPLAIEPQESRHGSQPGKEAPSVAVADAQQPFSTAPPPAEETATDRSQSVTKSNENAADIKIEPNVECEMSKCAFCGKQGPRRNFIGRFCSSACAERSAHNGAKRRHEGALRSGGGDEEELLLSMSATKQRRLSGAPVTCALAAPHESMDGDVAAPNPEVSVAGDLKMTIRLPNAHAHSSAAVTKTTGAQQQQQQQSDNSSNTPPIIPAPSKKFSWRQYLEREGAAPIPDAAFQETTGRPAFPTRPNPFKVGWFVEAVDAAHQSHICRMRIAQIQGYRLRLHIDGEYACYDQWVNADSPLLFPCGFCERTGRQLSLVSPRNDETPSTPDEFRRFDPAATPDAMFAPAIFENATRFRIGDKLEAVDRQHSELTCVATVVDAVGECVLVHFDGWQSEYDFWARDNSPFLHPLGWCAQHGKELSSPPNYDTQWPFSWPKYLANTKSRAARPESFASAYRPSDLFTPGMKLEVVDLRNPILVRVASIVETDDCRVKVRFDGWSELFDCWMDADSLDLHPPTWCLKTGHLLQPPIDARDFTGSSLRKGCTIPGCYGLGHLNWSREHFYHKKHFSEHGCPYSPQNLARDLPLNRFSLSGNSSDEGKPPAQGHLKDDSPCAPAPGQLTGVDRKPKRGRPRKISALPNGNGKMAAAPRKSISRQKSSRLSSEHARVNHTPLPAPVYPHTQTPLPECWEQVVQLLPGVDSLRASDVSKWDIKTTATFVGVLTDGAGNSDAFVRDEIDGDALLLLTQDDLTKQLKIKLGPAIKIYNAALLFKSREELSVT